VSDWTAKLEPILKAQEESSVFDIHAYSDNLLLDLSTAVSRQASLFAQQAPVIPEECEIGVISFEELVHGESSAETCRKFLACLQLANYGNVEVIPPENRVESISLLRQSSKNKRTKAREQIETQGKENVVDNNNKIVLSSKQGTNGTSKPHEEVFKLRLLSSKRISKINDFMAPSLVVEH
jgi:hypothetical protein